MGRRAKHQTDQRADLRGGGFIGIPGVVHRSEAYRSLPVFERAVLTEIIAAFNGYNNGKIVLSQRQISDALGNTNFGKIGRAIAVLMERGLIDVTAEGEWKPRKAREYRLTFVTSGAPPYTNPATNDYLRWQKIGADTVSAETPQSADTVSAEARIAADTVSASRPQNPQKCVNGPKFPADTVSSLIVKPYQGPFKRGPLNGLKYPSPDLDGLRSEVKEFLSGRTTADAELLAGWAGLPIDRLSAFLMGEGLSDQQQQSLPVALGVMLEPTDLQCGIGDLREWVREVIASLPYGGARELAQDAAVPEPILSRFRNGKGLPNEYRASLQHACARHIPFNQRTRRDV